MKKALVVLEKEWLDLRLQRALLLATIFLPPAITALAILVFFIAGRFQTNVNTGGVPLPREFAGLTPVELGQAIVGRQFSVLFLLLPIFVPSVLGSYAIVGEKRERTLEPVLATPVRTWELLLGKMLAALLPALVVTLAAAAVFVVGTAVFAISDRVRDIVITPGWVLALALDAPLLALIGIGLIVILSSRVNDPRTAQQISAVLVVPVLGLLFGQLAGVIVLGPTLAVVIAVILGLLGAGVVWTAGRLFQREVILTRWR